MRRLLFILLIVLSLPLFYGWGKGWFSGNIVRVSETPSGTSSDGESDFPRLSADGKMVAFRSSAANLLPETKMRDAYHQIYARNLEDGSLVLVSVGQTDGQVVEANSDSTFARLSANGRTVVFESIASNLVPNTTNRKKDIFVRDLVEKRTERVSTRLFPDGKIVEGNDNSQHPSISGDGRFIVFESRADNLVGGLQNKKSDIYLFDREKKEMTDITVNSKGFPPNDDCSYPVISADGRFVAYESRASNLIPNDHNNLPDIFVYDVAAKKTERVSVGLNGTETNGYSFYPSISADGRTIAFSSNADNLIANDTNRRDNVYHDGRDIFVYDRTSKKTERISVAVDGAEANDSSFTPAMSGDGRYVVFVSFATNLVPNDNRKKGFFSELGVFVHDRRTHRTARISFAYRGEGIEGNASKPSISGDGRLIAFRSEISHVRGGKATPVSDVFVAVNPLYP